MTKLTGLVLVIGLSFAAPAAFAQDTDPGTAKTFSDLDTNGDNLLMLEEWVSANLEQERFNGVDTNADGAVSEYEFEAAYRADSEGTKRQ